MSRLPVAIACPALLLLASCGSPSPALDDLARAGHIDEDAPIRAERSIVIDAPETVVWKLLADIDRWPQWQPKIRAARLDGAFAVGRAFTWDNDGMEISSRLALIHPFRTLAWTGSAFGLHAVHVWTLSSQRDGHVLVSTNESMRGFPASLFYSSKALAETNDQWLRALKRRAESQR